MFFEKIPFNPQSAFFHWVFIIPVFFLVRSDAQPSLPKTLFDHWSQTDGYPATQAVCMVKSAEGYLWIGSEQGLIRFDGHRFEDFRFIPNDSNSITGTYVSHIAIDKYERLWLGVDQSLNVYDINTNRFTKLLSSDGKELYVKAFRYDRQSGKMWIGTTEGLYVNEANNLQIRKIEISEMKGRERIETIHIDGQGNLWLASTFGIFQYHPDEGYIAEYHRPGADSNDPTSDGILSSFLDSSKHILWLGCWQFGLLKMDLLSKTIRSYEYQDAKKMQNGILDIQPSPLREQRDQLWLATVDGLMRFDLRDSNFYSYQSEILNDPGAISGVPLGFNMADQEGLWIGSTTGLHRLDHNKQQFQSIYLNLVPEYQDNKIHNIEIEKSSSSIDSLIWLYVDGHGLVHFDLMHQKKIPLPPHLKKYEGNMAGITDIHIDEKGEYLWILSTGFGIEAYDIASSKLITFSFQSESKDPIPFYSAASTSEGDLILSSLDKLFYLNKRNRSIVPFTELNMVWKDWSLSSTAINIAIDAQNRLCIHVESTQIPRDRWILYDINSQVILENSAFPTVELTKLSYIKALQFNQKGQLCVTSENGLALIENVFSSTPTIYTLLSSEKRFLTRLEGIVDDSLGNFWISSISGIVCIIPDNLGMIHLDYTNSTLSQSRNPSITISPNGNSIYVGQLDVIDIAQMGSLKRISNRPVLSRLEIDGRRIYGNIQSGDVIQLNYNTSSVYFEFSDLCFTNALDNDYYFQFGKESTQWIDNRGNSFRFYNIGPGEHPFRLRINDPSNDLSENEFLLTIKVSRPFWLSWWFYGIICSVAMGLIYFLFRYREKERWKIEKMRQALSRDFHDQIGSSLSSVRLLSEMEGKKARPNPSFQKISTGIAEIMQQLSEIIWSIDPKYDSLTDVLTKLCSLGIELFESRSIGFQFEAPSDLGITRLSQEDRRHIYLTFKEAMNNTVKYAEARNVLLKVVREKKYFNILLKDDGKGFDPAAVFWSNGINNMRARAELLGGHLDIQSGGLGTEIRLSIRI